MARKTVERNIAYDDVRNKFYVTLHYGVEDGKQIKETKTFTKKGDAQRALREFEGKKVMQQIVMPKNYTLSEWLESWLREFVLNKKAKTTYSGYRFIVDNHIMPKIGTIKLQELNEEVLEGYFNEQRNVFDAKGKRRLSDNTLRKHYVLLQTALQKAVHRKLIKSNPLEHVDAPEYTKPKINFYTLEQSLELLRKVDNDFVLKPTVYLALYTGLRREEIAGLQWSDIDFSNSIISITRARVRAGNEIVIKGPKNKSSERTIFMCERLSKVLKEVREVQLESKELLGNLYSDTGYVVVNQYGEEINPGYLSSLFGKFVKKNNLPKITLHGLRHTAASIMYDDGVIIEKISDILGHADITTTDRIYTHRYNRTHEDVMTAYGNKLDIKK